MKKQLPDPKPEVDLSSGDNTNETTKADHLGSSRAFEKTENTASRDADNLSDEKLDEWLDPSNSKNGKS